MEVDGKIGVSGWKKRKPSINMVSHDAPIHLPSATLHHGGATNAHDAFTIRYGANTVQDGSATTCSSYCIRDVSD